MFGSFEKESIKVGDPRSLRGLNGRVCSRSVCTHMEQRGGKAWACKLGRTVGTTGVLDEMYLPPLGCPYYIDHFLSLKKDSENTEYEDV